MEMQREKEKRLFVETFGCQMNENDSERIIGILKQLNYKPTDDVALADMIILNTCSIRDKAEQKVYSALGRLKKLKACKPDLIIGVGGCVAQQKGEGLLKRAPHLNMVFGTHNIHRLPDLIHEVMISMKRVVATDFFDTREQDESFSYLKDGLEDLPRTVKTFVTIMRGCDNFCSYCIVPYVRGRESSRKSSDILLEAKSLVESGIKEITLVGQNVNSYGNKGEDISFPELLRRVCRIDGIERVRFITSHPKDISEELIKLFGEEENLCRHIHLPLQSGSDIILQRMNRGYTREGYLRKVFNLKNLYPDMAITTDIIVGFPGETEMDFLDTLNLIEEVEFDNIFSFQYSPRPATKAASFDTQIPEHIKEERLWTLQKAQSGITLRKNKKMVGSIVDVLIEGKSKGVAGSGCGSSDSELDIAIQKPKPQARLDHNRVQQLTGRTSCNRVVNFLSRDEYRGKVVPVRIMKASLNSLLGEVQ